MKENKMGTMPVGRLILSMSWPAIISMLIQAMYNVVDSFFVSKVSEDALAAITYIFPMQMVMMSFAIGTGVGINSLISRRLGAHKFDEANLAASHGYRLAFITWAFFGVFGLLCSHPFMSFMTNTEYIVTEGSKYLTIVLVGSIFVFVQIISEKILQATGNMIFPMICSILGALTNIVLDPILIFGLGPFPAMGVTGAAVATVTGQLFSMILGQILLFKVNKAIRVKIKGWKWNGRIVKDIYAVGAPAILMQCIASVMQVGMNLILGTYTETAVAVMGIYGRLQSFIFMPVFGLNQGVLPILGFNFGARNKKRLIDAYKKGFAFAFTIMATGLIIFQLFPHQLINIFNSQGNADMYEVGIIAMRYVSLCFIPASYGIMTSSVFQATGHGMYSFWSSLIRQLIGILPLAFILGKLFGLNAIWLSFPLAEILGTLYLVLAYLHLYKNEIKTLGE